MFLQVAVDERTIYYDRHFMIPGIDQCQFGKGGSDTSVMIGAIYPVIFL